MPKVSICIPTFNRREYLKDTLGSVFSQSYQNYEVIIVDDGSTDGTDIMVQNFGKPIRYDWQENGGDAKARNRLIELSQGDYITFIDSDDLLMPYSVEDLLHAIELHGENVCSYGHYIRINAQGQELKTKKACLPSGNITSALFQRILVHSCGSMFPRNVLAETTGFDTNLRVCSDYKMWLEISLHHSFIPVSRPTFKRRRHSGNISAVSVPNILTELKVLEDFYYHGGGKNVIPESIALKRFAKEYFRAGQTARKQKDISLAVQYYKKAFKLSSMLKHWIYWKIAWIL